MRLEQVFNDNQKFLWGLSYRMTGSAADADDILQETFVRLMQKPPADTEEPLRPWLVRVAVNLSRDILRRRKRQDRTIFSSPVAVNGLFLSLTAPHTGNLRNLI